MGCRAIHLEEDEAQKEEDQMSQRWQDDKEFVSWLYHMGYSEPKNDKSPRLKMGGGIYLYMYEAWRASRQARWTSARTLFDGV